MIELSKQLNVIHVGYGLKYGGRAAGSLKNVPDNQIIETPVAENLMLGLAIGLSLTGKLPIVYYERFDFIMNAMDALVNHLDKIEKISYKEFKPKVIIRCVVGGKKSPFFTGVTHTQDFTNSLKNLLTNVNVVKLVTPSMILPSFKEALLSEKSTIIVEEKDLYSVTI